MGSLPCQWASEGFPLESGCGPLAGPQASIHFSLAGMWILVWPRFLPWVQMGSLEQRNAALVFTC